MVRLLVPTLKRTVLQLSMKMTSPLLPKPELYLKLLLLLADCLRLKPNLRMYQSSLTMALVFLAVKLKSVFMTSRIGFEEIKLPRSEMGVTVIGSTLIPASKIDQINLVAEG